MTYKYSQDVEKRLVGRYGSGGSSRGLKWRLMFWSAFWAVWLAGAIVGVISGW
jgi:hypothetical protein